MPEINISVRDKVAAQTGRGVMVCDNSDYVLVFDFDEEWAAYTTKTARLRWGGAYTDVVFDGDRCPCPAISDTALVRVGVYAGDLHTSTPAIVPCLPSIRGGDGAPADPAPDVYDQLMEKLNSMGEVSEEEIAAAVDAYMAENPVAGAFTVHITYDEETDTYSADKTFAEIKAAYDAGQVVQAEYDGALFALSTVAEDFASFGATYSADGVSLQWDTLMMSADGTVYFDTVEAAQADWSQNDENASDYIKNRTHYEKLTFVSEAVLGGPGSAMTPAENGYSGDKRYTVIFNGRKYTGLAFTLNAYALGMRFSYLGFHPKYLSQSDVTSIPFCIFDTNPDAYPDITTPGKILNYQCSTVPESLLVYEDESVPLDEKYIPDSIARKTDIPTVPTIPTTLPNPNKLTLTGAVEAEYNGSTAVTVEIPEGGGDSSLGITGAAVGQTVKITEVDDEGKPTRWEAVDVVTPDMFKLVNIATYNLSEMEFPTNIPIDLGQYNEIYAVFVGVTTESGGQISAVPYPGADYNSMYYLGASFGAKQSTLPYGDTVRFHFKKITKAGYAFDANAAQTDYLFVGVCSCYGNGVAAEKQNVGSLQSPHNASWPYPYWLKLTIAEGETVTGGTLVVLGRRLA